MMDPFAPPRVDDSSAPDRLLSSRQDAQLTYLHATAAPKILFGSSIGGLYGLLFLGDLAVLFSSGWSPALVASLVHHILVGFAALTALIAGIQSFRASDHAPEHLAGPLDTEELFWQIAGAGVLASWFFACGGILLGGLIR